MRGWFGRKRSKDGGKVPGRVPAGLAREVARYADEAGDPPCQAIDGGPAFSEIYGGRGGETMAGELHAPRERLSRETIHLHQALSSLMEELEAIDWYRQRADDCEDTALKAILLHNMKEEMEHAAMTLEWIRRASPDFDHELRSYLFKDGPITKLEAEIMGREK